MPRDNRWKHVSMSEWMEISRVMVGLGITIQWHVGTRAMAGGKNGNAVTREIDAGSSSGDSAETKLLMK